MSIYKKLREIPDGILGILTVVFILIPVVYPMGLPIQISAPTKGFYNTLKNLPEGSIICIDAGGGFASWDEFEASMTATLKVLLSSPVKWFSWGYSMDGSAMVDIVLDAINPESYGKVYGEDYLVLPYISGVEMAVAAVAADTQAVATKDYYGNDLTQYPLWSELGNADDYALVLSISGSCLNMDQETRQWYTLYGKKLLEINMACCSPMSMNYFPDVMPGGLWGVKGGTELEVLSKFPGPGARLSDAQNLGLMPFILFLILGNIGYFGSKYIEKEDERK
jgi:hypothetical protein